jgi:IS5 family transposase
MISKLLKIAKDEKIQLRRTYVREIKQHRINLRFFKHPKKIKKVKESIKRLRTIVGILIRDISRKLPQDRLDNYQETFTLFEKVSTQKPNDKNKIYSLHEQDIYLIAKGKEHKKYEFGTKASIVATKQSGIIIGVVAHKTNIHDSKTLQEVLTKASQNREKPIKEAIYDRGYRGEKEILDIK